jgi:hypothetical protein
MKTYSINDLLYGKLYYPKSLARRHEVGEINYSEKRDNIYLAEGYEAYAIRFSTINGRTKWATIAVKVAD